MLLSFVFIFGDLLLALWQLDKWLFVCAADAGVLGCSLIQLTWSPRLDGLVLRRCSLQTNKRSIWWVVQLLVHGSHCPISSEREDRERARDAWDGLVVCMTEELPRPLRWPLFGVKGALHLAPMTFFPDLCLLFFLLCCNLYTWTFYSISPCFSRVWRYVCMYILQIQQIV